MGNKYTKNYLYNIDAIDVYKLVLEGKYVKKFPENYWQQEDAMVNGIKCVKFLIFDILKATPDNMFDFINIKVFKEYKLLGMLRACFNASPYELINNMYPDKFKPWELPNAPKYIWTKENVANATKWLIEDKLKLSDEELKKQLSIKLFKANGLLGMLNSIENKSPYEAINLAYPGKFQPWEFGCVSRNYWGKETGKQAVKWLVEEKLNLKKDEDFLNLTKKVFLDNGLYGMYQVCFNRNLYNAINSVYPNRFKPWQFKQIPNGYWHNIDNCINATKWLIDNKLNIKDFKKVNNNTFKKNGLSWMLVIGFNNDYKKALNIAYPNILIS